MIVDIKGMHQVFDITDLNEEEYKKIMDITHGRLSDWKEEREKCLMDITAHGHVPQSSLDAVRSVFDIADHLTVVVKEAMKIREGAAGVVATESVGILLALIAGIGAGEVMKAVSNMIQISKYLNQKEPVDKSKVH